MTNGSIDDQVAAIRAAVACGINHFDTAAFYGYGASEIYLGQALRTAAVKDAVITTKVAISREYLDARLIRKAVRQSVEQSLFRLRRDRVEILLLHNASHRTRAAYDPATDSERVAAVMNNYLPPLTFDDIAGEDGVLEEIDLLITEGKVGKFGLSGQDNDPLILKALVATGRLSLFNQSYSLLNPSAGHPGARGGQKITGAFARTQEELFIEFDDVIEAARKADVAVSVISALAAGVLTDAAQQGALPSPVVRRQNRFPFDGEYERQLGLARQFKPIADQAGISLTELAIRFVLSTPGVTTLVAGFSTADQVREICQYAGKAPLGDDIYAAMRDVWFQ
jgi:aryl-alcohol dehydrogenase-like predicted oxidoreductase